MTIPDIAAISIACSHQLYDVKVEVVKLQKCLSLLRQLDTFSNMIVVENIG